MGQRTQLRLSQPLMNNHVSLDFTLTLACNNHCVFCPRTALKPIATTPRQAIAAIRTAGGCREAAISGGEPTLLKRLPSIATGLKRAGAKTVAIITNGRALSEPEYLNRLVAAGVTSFTISLYSHRPAIHDRLTRAEGSCLQTWKGLRNAIDLARTGLINQRVNLVLCAENIRSVETTLKILKSLNNEAVTLINLSGPAALNNIFSYSKVKILAHQLSSNRTAYPEHIIFRGFPLCIFANETIAENQTVDMAGGVSGKRLLQYSGVFSREFVKPAALCQGCPKNSYCNGVHSSYFNRYALAGLR